MSVLEFDEVHRAYERGRDVLHGVSFAVEPGQVVGLLGRNGAGKTTLIRLALGVLAPGRGRVRLFGGDPRADVVARRRRLGYVAEDEELPGYLTVAEAIGMHRALCPTWDEALAARLGARFALPARARLAELSRGQARQVALLCAVAHRPELLLLDEPAGGLDPVARREFLETALELLHEAGTAIVFSSHYMGDVERLAERIVMIHEWRLILDRGLEEVREGFALALLPASAAANGARARLLALDDCLVARERGATLRAIFRLPPEAACALLRRELGVAEIACTRIPLEELFLELAGGES